MMMFRSGGSPRPPSDKPKPAANPKPTSKPKPNK